LSHDAHSLPPALAFSERFCKERHQQKRKQLQASVNYFIQFQTSRASGEWIEDCAVSATLSSRRWKCGATIWHVKHLWRAEARLQLQGSLGASNRILLGSPFWVQGYAVSTVGFELEAGKALHPRTRHCR